MITVRAHFDGKVFVPDEPVELPVDTPLLIEVRQPKSDAAPGSLADAILDFAAKQKPVEPGDRPTDGSINYKHYLYGHPKQS